MLTCFLELTGSAQQSPVASAPQSQIAVGDDRLIPDAAMLLMEVREHQQANDAIRRHYMYHILQTTEAVDSDGNVKKAETEDRDFDYVDGVPIRRLVKRNGKELTADEKQKEEERIQKKVAHAKQEEAKGEKPHEGGGGPVNIKDLLEFAVVSDPRRIQMNGRDTIVYDYTGNPDAKAKNINENVQKKLSGTLWIDEKDRQVAKMTARFDDTFHVAGGLVASIQKGSEFNFEQALIHDEVWLPASETQDVNARLLLVKGIHQRDRAEYSDYRKYISSSTILDGTAVVQPNQPQ
jgi:hypothetical protein